MTKKIIVVEDEPQIAELLGLLLDSPHVRLIHFQTGSEGLEAIRTECPDLVLLDVMLPEMTGWEIFDAIRSDESICQMPIIMLSVSQQEMKRRANFINSPINFYMTKPFDALQLRKQIDRIMGETDWVITGSTSAPRPGSEVQSIGDKLKSSPESSAQPESEKPVRSAEKESDNPPSTDPPPDPTS